jgi:hypothetical protein
MGKRVTITEARLANRRSRRAQIRLCVLPDKTVVNAELIRRSYRCADREGSRGVAPLRHPPLQVVALAAVRKGDLAIMPTLFSDLKEIGGPRTFPCVCVAPQFCPQSDLSQSNFTTTTVASSTKAPPDRRAASSNKPWQMSSARRDQS